MRARVITRRREAARSRGGGWEVFGDGDGEGVPAAAGNFVDAPKSTAGEGRENDATGVAARWGWIGNDSTETS